MKSSQLETLWQGRLGITIVLTIFGCLTITACGAWHWFANWLESPNAPAWVQAVGSIMAMAISIWIVSWGQRQKRKAAQEAAIAYGFSLYVAARELITACERQLDDRSFQRLAAVVSATNGVGAMVAPRDLPFREVRVLIRIRRLGAELAWAADAIANGQIPNFPHWQREFEELHQKIQFSLYGLGVEPPAPLSI